MYHLMSQAEALEELSKIKAWENPPKALNALYDRLSKIREGNLAVIQLLLYRAAKSHLTFAEFKGLNQTVFDRYNSEEGYAEMCKRYPDIRSAIPQLLHPEMKRLIEMVWDIAWMIPERWGVGGGIDHFAIFGLYVANPLIARGLMRTCPAGVKTELSSMEFHNETQLLRLRWNPGENARIIPQLINLFREANRSLESHGVLK